METSLDADIKEAAFWEMTPAELGRAIESFNRRKKLELQNKASFDYIQANMIIKGVSIVLGDKSHLPSIEETYPSLFTEHMFQEQEKIQQRKDELSALRFKQFAQSYNERFKNKEVPKADI